MSGIGLELKGEGLALEVVGSAMNCGTKEGCVLNVDEGVTRGRRGCRFRLWAA